MDSTADSSALATAAPPPGAGGFYASVLRALNDAHLPYLVGGAFAFAHYSGIARDTKDLDLFIRRDDWERCSTVLQAQGWEVTLSFPHWLGKAHRGDDFVDLIFNSGNGLSPVDDSWFAPAERAEVLGVPVLLCPPEESLWTKAFIMERERFDGADVAHLLRACADRLNWPRLLARFGIHWRVLLAHLVLFGFVWPGERQRIPAGLVEGLLARLQEELQQAAPETKLCAGTLLSREQYLPDVEQQGFVDSRATPLSTMRPGDIRRWTEAIPRRADEAGGDDTPPAA